MRASVSLTYRWLWRADASADQQPATASADGRRRKRMTDLQRQTGCAGVLREGGDESEWGRAHPRLRVPFDVLHERSGAHRSVTEPKGAELPEPLHSEAVLT
jgi:hypothetical protein